MYTEKHSKWRFTIVGRLILSKKNPTVRIHTFRVFRSYFPFIKIHQKSGFHGSHIYIYTVRLKKDYVPYKFYVHTTTLALQKFPINGKFLFSRKTVLWGLVKEDMQLCFVNLVVLKSQVF